MMNTQNQHPHHRTLTSIILNIANGLRGTYRPPQYRLVMLPLIVLARFDAILSTHTDEMKTVFEENQKQPENARLPQTLLDKKLTNIVGKERKQTLYNVSGFNLARLLDDPEHIRANFSHYINGFSAKAKDIFDKFNFESELDKLDEANRLS